MPKKKTNEKTRQIYASINEELYLAAKARAAAFRIPMRELIEHALRSTLDVNISSDDRPSTNSIWEDEYIKMQSQQPLGSPIELTKEEAAAVLKSGFGSH